MGLPRLWIFRVGYEGALDVISSILEGVSLQEESGCGWYPTPPKVIAKYPRFGFCTFASIASCTLGG